MHPLTLGYYADRAKRVEILGPSEETPHYMSVRSLLHRLQTLSSVCLEEDL
jgi:hypothetical protein